MRQVTAGHPPEPRQPPFEPAVPAVDVLNVDRTAFAFSSADVDRLVGNAGGAGKPGVGYRTVGDEQYVAGQDWLQAEAQLRCRHGTTAGMKIQRQPIAVTGDQQAIVLAVDA